MKGISRYGLSDEQWRRSEPVRPPSKKEGRPRAEDRRILNGLRWILRTGAPWRVVPERHGSWSAVYSRFNLWHKAGEWDRPLNSTIVRAHQHAAGAKKGTHPEKLSGAVNGLVVPKFTSAPSATVSP